MKGVVLAANWLPCTSKVPTLVRNVPVADVPEPPQLKSRAGVPD